LQLADVRTPVTAENCLHHVYSIQNVKSLCISLVLESEKVTSAQLENVDFGNGNL